MTLLSIVQTTCSTIGIPSPTAVIGNTDTNVAQILSISNLLFMEISRSQAWAELAKLTTWTTVAGSDQGPVTTVIGPDFDRFVPGTEWDRSLIRPLPGPRSPQGWAQDQAFVAAGPYYNFRIYGFPAHVYIFPDQAAGDELSWEYTSKNWCQSALGVGQTQWVADTDVAVLDETMLTEQLIVRVKAEKGLRFDANLVYSADTMEERRGSNGGKPKTLRIGGGIDRMPWPVIPEGNWPSS